MDAIFGNKPTTDTDSTKPEKDHPKPSNAELLSSAKLVAEAAQSAISNQSDKIDKAKIAGAADDLLSAASDYGKLGEKGMGQYVEKAEEFLHQYSSQGKTTEPPAPAAKPEEKAESGGYGDVMKMAGGLFK